MQGDGRVSFDEFKHAAETLLAKKHEAAATAKMDWMSREGYVEAPKYVSKEEKARRKATNKDGAKCCPKCGQVIGNCKHTRGD